MLCPSIAAQVSSPSLHSNPNCVLCTFPYMIFQRPHSPHFSVSTHAQNRYSTFHLGVVFLNRPRFSASTQNQKLRPISCPCEVHISNSESPLNPKSTFPFCVCHMYYVAQFRNYTECKNLLCNTELVRVVTGRMLTVVVMIIDTEMNLPLSSGAGALTEDTTSQKEETSASSSCHNDRIYVVRFPLPFFGDISTHTC